MSSPALNNVIATGCIFAYLSLILAGLETRYLNRAVYSTLCQVSCLLNTMNKYLYTVCALARKMTSFR